MKNKYNFAMEKIFFFIPLLMFILYTNAHIYYALKSNSELIFEILRRFNALYMKGPYIFLGLSIVLAIYIFINGNKKQKLITIATAIGCFFMYYNFKISTERIDYLTTLLFVSSYLIGIYYTISLLIYFKDKNINDIKKKVIKGLKVVVIYIAIIFLLAILSNTTQYSYNNAQKGMTGWIQSTNGLGHALVFLLPLFILLYVKNKKHTYLFYIVIIAVLDLLIGTKACYYGLMSTLIVVILYLLLDRLRHKKYHYFKLLSLAVILILVILMKNNFYASKNIEKSIRQNTSEQGKVDIVNFVISGRDSNVKIIAPFYKNSNVFTKTFGLAIYYPRFNFIYTELDLFDLLYLRGIYGFILYIYFYVVIIFNILKNVFKNIKKCFDIDILLMLLTLGYIGFASIFVGHVLFNLMPLTVAIMLMLYYIFTINKKLET